MAPFDILKGFYVGGFVITYPGIGLKPVQQYGVYPFAEVQFRNVVERRSIPLFAKNLVLPQLQGVIGGHIVTTVELARLHRGARNAWPSMESLSAIGSPMQESGTASLPGSQGARNPAALLQQLSAIADDDDNWEADPAFLQYLEAKYRDVECPLFLDTMPADPSSDPQLHALQLLAYDGETPLSVAKRYRERGKELLTEAATAQRQGHTQAYRRKIQEAEDAYHRALAQGVEDKDELSLLHSNVALCCLKRGDLLRCIDHARAAIKCNPKNLKAYLREPTDDTQAEKELRVLQQEAKQRYEAQQQRRREAFAAAEKDQKTNQPSPKEILSKRGIRVCAVPPGLAEAAAQVPPVSVHPEVLTGEFFLLLPLLLLLDEYGRADAISAADERLSLMEQLKSIFPSKRFLERAQLHQGDQEKAEGAATEFPSWDHEKKYLLEDIVGYYEVLLGCVCVLLLRVLS
ncbi:TPR domain-containing protein [Cyclospora cayetanensis]|uniref:TPR domain-containing protein n=1 Tax=Cyclospora cayetanensis TaxID=88456 RepID=A0A1D3CZT6_9EIME|nr:TPR domain-containing protein [Cyclospora cayetanensis]